jgi:hypothetical protein
VSQPVRSLRGLNPLTRMSKREFFEGNPNMHFEAKKVIVVGGSAGIGRQAAVDVVDHGGSALNDHHRDVTVAQRVERCVSAALVLLTSVPLECA